MSSPQDPTPTPDENVIEMGGVIIRPGDHIGSYRYERLIGKGGMAHVLLAHDPNGDPVALKVLQTNRFKTGLTRFRREFRALIRVRHPNIISVESYGDLHGHPYIAMEYVPGTDLHRTIRGFRELNPPERWRRVVEILADMSAGLLHIHSRGLVHRDLKPSNVLIDADGRCRITDFGIVKLLDPDTDDPHVSNTLVGTWAYASPEQISGRTIDHRSDLYSLGVILYAMLTGRRPFSAKNMAGYLDMHQRQAPRPPSQLYPPVPRNLEAICLRLLEKAPQDRPQSAGEILEELGISARKTGRDAAGGAPPTSWRPPLIGRREQRAQLIDAISGLTRLQGGAVLIRGSEGAGKTRLMEEAIEQAHGLRIPVDRLEITAQEGAMDAILRLADKLSRDLGQNTPPLLNAAIIAFADNHGRQTDVDLRYRLFDGIKETMRALLARGPRVLAVDDLHLASNAMYALLGYLSRSLSARGEGLLLLATARDDLDSAALRWTSSAAELGLVAQGIAALPLTRVEVGELIARLLGPGSDAVTLAERLWRETEGNPLFVTEFLRSLIQQGIILQQADGSMALAGDAHELATGELEIPPGVRQVVQNRLAPLSREDNAIVEVLAAAGRPVEIDVLLDAVDSDDEEGTLDRIERLTAEGILEVRRVGLDPLYDFSHRKYGEVLLRELPSPRRSRLHLRLAAVLEEFYGDQSSAAEMIGEQYRQAGDAASAWRYLARAARYLWGRSLMGEASAVLERLSPLEDIARAALEPATYAQMRRELLQIRGDILLNQGAWQQAAGTWRALLLAAGQAGDWQQAAEGELKLGRALRRLGDKEEGERLIRGVFQRARARGDRTILINALHQLAAIAWESGDLERCERLAGQGLVAAQGPDLSGSRAQILLAMTAVQATRGQLAAATRGMAEAEEILRRLGRKQLQAPVLSNLAELLVMQGELSAALVQADAALVLAREVLHRETEGSALRIRARVRLELGELDSAETDLARSLALAEEMALSEDVAASRYLLGELSVLRGRPGVARGHLQAGLVASRQRDPEAYGPLSQALLAGCWCALDRPAVASKLIANLRERQGELPPPRRSQVLLLMARALLALGARAEALEAAVEAEQLARSCGLRLGSLGARGLLCRLLPPAEARDLQADSLPLLEAILRSAPADAEPRLRARYDLRLREEIEEEEDEVG